MPTDTSPESLSTRVSLYRSRLSSHLAHGEMQSTDVLVVGLNLGLLVSSAWNDCPLQILLKDRSRLCPVRRHCFIWKKVGSLSRLPEFFLLLLVESVHALLLRRIRCAWYFRLGKNTRTKKTGVDRRQKTHPMQSNIRLSVYPLCLFFYCQYKRCPGAQIAPTAQWLSSIWACEDRNSDQAVLSYLYAGSQQELISVQTSQNKQEKSPESESTWSGFTITFSNTME